MKKLTQMAREFFLPIIKVDEEKKEAKFISEGLFGSRILKTRYLIKGYTIIGEDDSTEGQLYFPSNH